jgi:hypothetical protein
MQNRSVDSRGDRHVLVTQYLVYPDNLDLID